MGFLRTLLGGDGRPGLAGPLVFVGGELIKGIGRAVRGNPSRTEFVKPIPQREPLTPETPAAPTAPVGASVYERHEPARGRAVKRSKKATERKRRRVDERALMQQLADQGIWPYSMFSDKISPGVKAAQTVAQFGQTLAMTRTGGNPPRPLPPTPGMGSRSAQRGFVAPELVPLIANPPMPAQAQPARVRPRPYPIAPTRTMPGVSPERVQPRPTAPETSVPEFYEPDIRTAIQRIPAAEPVYPGPGPATATPGTTRVPGPTGPSTAKPGKTGSRAPVALPSVGKIVLSPDALLTYAIGRLPRRSPAAGTISPGVGPTTAPSRTTARAALATLTQPQRVSQDNCDCEKPKKKDRRPRPPRSQCFTGTYTETARGLIKKRREQVPC